MEGVQRMVFKIIFFGLLLLVSILVLVEITKNYKIYKKAKQKQERQKTLRKKIKELVIKADC